MGLSRRLKMKGPLLISLATLFLVACSKDDQSTVVAQQYIHKYGFPITEKEWNSRTQDGKVVSVLEDGVTVSQNYSNGVLNGETTYSYPNSTINKESHLYTNNVLVKKTLFSQEGIPYQEFSYELDSKVVITKWNSEGAPLSIETYERELLTSGTYFNKNNEIESKVDNGFGTRTIRSNEGQLLLKDQIENGKLLTRTTYHSNGAIQSQLSYKDYKLDGDSITLSPTGNPVVKNSWKENKLNGLQVIYKNGFKSEEISYLNGKKEGLERHFDDSGKLVAEIPWKAGKKHGCVTEFLGENNNKIDWFFKGKSISSVRYKELEKRAQTQFEN